MMPVKKGQNWLPMIFHDFFGNEWIERAKSTSTPAVNIIENDKEYEVQIAAPGVSKEDISVNINEDNYLEITVEEKKENDEKDLGKTLTFQAPSPAKSRTEKDFGLLSGNVRR